MQFDPCGAMINRGNRILIVSGAQSSTILTASVANQMLVLSYFKFFVLFYLYTLYMIGYSKHKLSTKRVVLPQKKFSYYTPTFYLNVLVVL